MRQAVIAAITFVFLAVAPSTEAAGIGVRGFYEVVGVEDNDMLKMRAGPGTGYKVILGLPNGTVLRLHECDQTGGTRWCKVSLEQTRQLKGYVSWAYLRKL